MFVDASAITALRYWVQPATGARTSALATWLTHRTPVARIIASHKPRSGWVGDRQKTTLARSLVELPVDPQLRTSAHSTDLTQLLCQLAPCRHRVKHGECNFCNRTRRPLSRASENLRGLANIRSVRTLPVGRTFLPASSGFPLMYVSSVTSDNRSGPTGPDLTASGEGLWLRALRTAGGDERRRCATQS